MADGSVILLTGATGFIGTHIARCLIADATLQIVALVRADTQAAAARRLARAWWEWPDLVDALGGRVEVVAGDVRKPRLGLDEVGWETMTQRITHIIHAAADLRVDGALDTLRRTNVDGTARVLELAHAANRHRAAVRSRDSAPV